MTSAAILVISILYVLGGYSTVDAQTKDYNRRFGQISWNAENVFGSAVIFLLWPLVALALLLMSFYRIAIDFMDGR